MTLAFPLSREFAGRCRRSMAWIAAAHAAHEGADFMEREIDFA
jgi:hypothetical protein